MRTLLRKPAPAPESAAPAEPAAVEATANGNGAMPAPPSIPAPVSGPSCTVCGAVMATSQDWCLECGTAAPGRLGQRPGWRLGALVLALTLLLVGGAAVAGYAAVTGDAERQTAAQNPAPGTPVPAPAATPPAPAKPTSEPPKIEAPAPTTADSTADDLASPSLDDTTVAPVQPVPDTTGTDPGTGNDTSTTPDEPTFTAFDIKADDLEVYDPYQRPGAEFGDPADALADKDPFFDVTVPADGEDIGAGLVVDLGAVRTVREITFRTTTPDFGLEIYGVSKGIPPGINTGWRLLDDEALPDGEREITITLEDDGAKARRLLLWFGAAPNPDDPRVSIGELEVLG
ncbi:MAG: hypothetical protein JHC95_02860 [Solirubrobacteraceae bacterium]|nr:hypothetical protein [Solirubrobacteraceae bacterium]